MGSEPPIELKEINLDDYNNYWNDFSNITKKYENEPWAFKMGGWRWNSNNSIISKVGKTDYSKYIDYIANNG